MIDKEKAKEMFKKYLEKLDRLDEINIPGSSQNLTVDIFRDVGEAMNEMADFLESLTPEEYQLIEHLKE